MGQSLPTAACVLPVVVLAALPAAAVWLPASAAAAVAVMPAGWAAAAAVMMLLAVTGHRMDLQTVQFTIKAHCKCMSGWGQLRVEQQTLID